MLHSNLPSILQCPTAKSTPCRNIALFIAFTFLSSLAEFSNSDSHAMPAICSFDFRDHEQGISKTLPGGLERVELRDPNLGFDKVFKMEFFHERLENFRYPHCALLLSCVKSNGQTAYLRVDRTKTRDSCYAGTSQANVRNGNPFQAKGCVPTVIQQITFARPIDFHVFHEQMLRQSSEDFTMIGRNCKWFSYTLWEYILNAHTISVYDSDDYYVIEQHKHRDCERIRAFMAWRYWFGSWFMN